MTSETTIAQPPACRYCGRTGTVLENRPCCDRPEHADRALACADTADCLAYMTGDDCQVIPGARAARPDGPQTQPAPAPDAMETVLGAVLAGGCAASFTREPRDGILAQIDVFKDDGEPETHDGLGVTAAKALWAAALGAGLITGECDAGAHEACTLDYGCACPHHDPREQLARLRDDMHLVIRALADFAAVARANRGIAPLADAAP
ncbi:hypothetical protein [Trebonia sp.]|uniref:hypothetical protein n=1 Tax=Trebonia sp. TaxID=2767075 RepID=UPI00262D3601|nr:hypothetical protein [Trebonia sp.]